jgi:hypothetical protein
MKLTKAEVNNIMRVVTGMHAGNTERVRKKLAKGELDRELLGDAIRNTEESRNLIENLLDMKTSIL